MLVNETYYTVESIPGVIRVRARVRVFPESGFSSGPSPVWVSKYAAQFKTLTPRSMKHLNANVLHFQL